MAITAVYSLPYQAMTDPPHGPNLGENLAKAVEAELQRIDGQLAALDAGARGLIPNGYGKRTTASSSTTTEVGALRLDGMAVTLGRQYEISTSPLIMGSSVAGDLVDARVRTSTAGAATTASTQLTGLVETAYSSSGSQKTQALTVTYTPTATGTLSVLLSVSRDAGTGSAYLSAASIFPIELYVKDIGAAQPSTGINI